MTLPWHLTIFWSLKWWKMPLVGHFNLVNSLKPVVLVWAGAWLEKEVKMIDCIQVICHALTILTGQRMTSSFHLLRTPDDNNIALAAAGPPLYPRSWTSQRLATDWVSGASAVTRLGDVCFASFWVANIRLQDVPPGEKRGQTLSDRKKRGRGANEWEYERIAVSHNRRRAGTAHRY